MSNYSDQYPKIVYKEDDISRFLDQLAQSIVTDFKDLSQVILVGVISAGFPLAERLAKRIHKLTQVHISVGKLDASLYRDDLYEKGPLVTIRESHIPLDIQDKDVVLVDDVLFSGRTARAAIDALFDYGRPKRVLLAVLIDRVDYELPIKADYIGASLHIQNDEYIAVNLFEIDGEDNVTIQKKTSAS